MESIKRVDAQHEIDLPDKRPNNSIMVAAFVYASKSEEKLPFQDAFEQL